MSEEEKKAIETVESFIKYYKKNEHTGNRANLDVLREEINSIEFILNKYDVQQKELNNPKEIEKSHKEENGKLRVELEQYKGLNEALERSSEHVTQLTAENSDLKYQLFYKQKMIDELTQNEEKLKIELGKEKEKNKELEKQINLNKKTVEIAQTQILEYSQGYKDGLNKETTATAIVARELELNFIRQEIKHKYISKDKIKEIVDELEEQIAEFKEYVKDSEGLEKIYWKRNLAELVGARNSLEGLLEEKNV